MADKKLSKVVGGGGKALMMPITVVPLETQLWAKVENSAQNATNSTFYTRIGADHTLQGFDTATLDNTTGTEKQTIVDTGTGKEGVLTGVLLPAITAAGTQTITVTIDGSVTTFTPDLSPTSTTNRVLLGDFVPWKATTTTSTGQNYGSADNGGYGTSANQEITFITPIDSLARGLPIGMVFEDSMKVEIETTGAIEVGSATNKAVAVWLTSIPEGLL